MAQNDRSTGLKGYSGVKIPVRAATTIDITLSGEKTIDGVVLVTDDRVLVKDQDDAVENGVYVVDSSAWSRSKDFDGAYDIVKGSLVLVNEGDLNAETWWKVTSADDITIGEDELTFSKTGTLDVMGRETQIAAAGQLVFNLAGTSYQPGLNMLMVFVNGLLMVGGGVDYVETDQDTVTFQYALAVNDRVDFWTRRASSSVGAIDATNVGYRAALGPRQGIATNVAAALDSLSEDYLEMNVLAQIPQNLRASVQNRTNATNLSPYIQAALDALALLVVPQTGVALRFPRGTYLMSTAVQSAVLSKIKLFGDGMHASIVQIGAGVTGFYFSLLTNAEILDLGFRNGAKAFRFNTLNTDQSMVNFKRCALMDQTGIGVEATVGSNSTQLTLEECLLSGGATFVDSYCDYTKLTRCWASTTIAGSTFINRSGTFEVDSLLGVPSAGAGATSVWIENYGNLVLTRSRFGSEDGHGRTMFHHKVAGSVIRVRDCYCPTDDYFAKFDHLPKNLSLKGTDAYGGLGGASGGKGLWFAAGSEADRSGGQKFEIDDLDFPQKGLFNSTANNGAAASAKMLEFTYARYMTERQGEQSDQITCAEALASVDSAARPTDTSNTNVTVGTGAYPLLGAFVAKKLTCTAYPGEYAGGNDLIPPGAGNSGIVTAVVDMYVSGATKPFYFDAAYQQQAHRTHLYNGLNVVCFHFQPNSASGDQSYRITITDIPNGAVILLGRMRLFKGVKHITKAETVYSDLTATAVPNNAYINHNVGDRIEHADPTSAGFMGRVCKTAGQPGTFTTYGPVT